MYKNYTETKKFKQHTKDTHIYYRKPSVENDTNLIRLFAVNANVLKRTKYQYFDHPPHASVTIPDDFGGYRHTREIA